eukprot:Clim_evm3s71 gene=Clim_evmTU3s71
MSNQDSARSSELDGSVTETRNSTVPLMQTGQGRQGSSDERHNDEDNGANFVALSLDKMDEMPGTQSSQSHGAPAPGSLQRRYSSISVGTMRETSRQLSARRSIHESSIQRFNSHVSLGSGASAYDEANKFRAIKPSDEEGDHELMLDSEAIGCWNKFLVGLGIITCGLTEYFRKWLRKRQGGQKAHLERTHATGETPELEPHETFHGKHHFPTNKISSTKYTVINFIPKNLWIQFHRVANIYFLLLVVLNYIPQVSAFSSATAAMPLILVLSATAIKDASEDIKRHRSDKEVNGRKTKVLRTGEWVSMEWRSLHVGDVVKLHNGDIVPADMLLLGSTGPNGVAFLETANIDGETNLKQRHPVPLVNDALATDETAFFKSELDNMMIYCEPPNVKVYQFNGSVDYRGDVTVVDGSNLLLRGCVLRNVDHCIGVVCYTGMHTKVVLNTTPPRPKRSKLEKTMNPHVLLMLTLLVVFCTVCAIGHKIFLEEREPVEELPYFSFEDGVTSDDVSALISFFTFVILFHGMVPISLYISMELIKIAQLYFMVYDQKMYDPVSDRWCQPRAFNLNEDLGQIEYIFSDKTGTLTENEMILRKLQIGHDVFNVDPLYADGGADPLAAKRNAGKTLASKAEKKDSSEKGDDLDDAVKYPKVGSIGILEKKGLDYNDPASIAHYMFLCIMLCSTVYPASTDDEEADEDGDTNGDIVEEPAIVKVSEKPKSIKGKKGKKSLVKKYMYEGESPDEVALAERCYAYGYKLVERSSETAVLEIHGEYFEYDLLDLIEFDSDRKRMSMFVRCPGGEIKHLCKGADSIMLALLDDVEEQKELAPTANQNLSKFSREGFRTLVMAMRDVPADRYSEFSQEWLQAGLESDPKRKAQALSIASAKMEQSLRMLGITAVEDRLQDDVPETVLKMHEAGICVWMLTGDKLETGHNIARSANLLLPNMAQYVLDYSRRRPGQSARDMLDDLLKVIAERHPEIHERVLYEEDKDLQRKQRKARGVCCWCCSGDWCCCGANDVDSDELYNADLSHRPTFETAAAMAGNADNPHPEAPEDPVGEHTHESDAQQALSKYGVGKHADVDSNQTDSNANSPTKEINAKSHNPSGSSTLQNNKDSSGTTSSTDCSDANDSSFEDVFESTGTGTDGIGLVIEGQMLAECLKERNLPAFLQLVRYLRAVCCCRVTPLQKSEVVTVVKNHFGRMTLAIGDGANDVSMIMSAHIGVGISGKEGMQAVMASDFAIAKFRFLAPLMLVHGAWSYSRLSRMLRFFFFKNLCIVGTIFFFQFFNGFSGQYNVAEVVIVMYNALLTFFPVISIGMFEMHVSRRDLERYPVLYQAGPLDKFYNWSWFLVSLLRAAWTASCVYWIPYLAYRDDYEGADLYSLGFVWGACLVLTVNLDLAIMTMTWTWPHACSMILSVAIYWIIGAVVYTTPSDSNFGVLAEVASTAKFWMIYLVVPVFTLTPHLIGRTLWNILSPYPTDIVRNKQYRPEGAKSGDEESGGAGHGPKPVEKEIEHHFRHHEGVPVRQYMHVPGAL